MASDIVCAFKEERKLSQRWHDFEKSHSTETLALGIGRISHAISAMIGKACCEAWNIQVRVKCLYYYSRLTFHQGSGYIGSSNPVVFLSIAKNCSVSDTVYVEVEVWPKIFLGFPHRPSPGMCSYGESSVLPCQEWHQLMQLALHHTWFYTVHIHTWTVFWPFAHAQHPVSGSTWCLDEDGGLYWWSEWCFCFKTTDLLMGCKNIVLTINCHSVVLIKLPQSFSTCGLNLKWQGSHVCLWGEMTLHEFIHQDYPGQSWSSCRWYDLRDLCKHLENISQLFKMVPFLFDNRRWRRFSLSHTHISIAYWIWVVQL